LIAQTSKNVYPKERMYLQTDKQLYLAGELLWLKALTTDGEGIPLDLSKVGYIELLDGSSSLARVKLELKNGIGEGTLLLPVTLHTGNYRLVGYTRYMLNEGESIFFEKTVPVINTFVIDPTIQVTDDPITPKSSMNNTGANLNISPSQLTYSTRSSGKIRIHNLPDNIHTLSVSIAGCDIPEYTSASSISEWKNDLSTLHKPVFSGDFIPEYEGHIVTGQLIDLTTGQMAVMDEYPIALMGFVGNQIRLFTGQIDSAANISFYTKRISGMHEIATTTLSPSVKQYRVDIHSPFITHLKKETPLIKLNVGWNDFLLDRSIGLQVLHTYLADSLEHFGTENAFFQWKPDWQYQLDDYTRFTTMEEVVIEFIPGLRFRRINNQRVLSVLTEERTGYTTDNSLVLLDGIPIIDHSIIFNYDPLLVKQIDIYRGKYFFNNMQFDGIVMFKTYENNYPGLTVTGPTQLYDYEGTQSHRYFYAPTYQTEDERKSRMPDYRHTLLWEPQVEIGCDTEISIPFTTSDLTGDFVITMEGLTETGEPIYATCTIKVE